MSVIAAITIIGMAGTGICEACGRWKELTVVALPGGRRQRHVCDVCMQELEGK